MAFKKRVWKDRLAEFPGRRRLTNVETGAETIVDVERDEGLVPQAGDAFSALNMNDLEERIGEAFEAGGLEVEYASRAGHAKTADRAEVANSVSYTNVSGRPILSLSGDTLTINF